MRLKCRALLLAAADDAKAAERLQAPRVGLPALFITQYAQAQLWLHWGITPVGLIGHSMGEYTAACLAGVFSVADALALVTTRARLFETVSEGAMLSVPLGARELAEAAWPGVVGRRGERSLVVGRLRARSRPLSVSPEPSTGAASSRRACESTWRRTRACSNPSLPSSVRSSGGSTCAHPSFRWRPTSPETG